MTTMKSTPVSAAIGTSSMTLEAMMMKSRNMMEANVVLKRPTPPLLTLMVDCPIMASPPMDWNIADIRLEAPCAMHSCVQRPVLSVVSSRISSTSWSVRMLSIRPTSMREMVVGMMIWSASLSSLTSGILNSGRPPLTGAMSFTVGVSSPMSGRFKPCSSARQHTMDTSDEGTALVTRGRKCTTNIDPNTYSSMIHVEPSPRETHVLYSSCPS
mmetsp:Transcript_15216/g.49945  ORF Transcript_15216/g.49945 Transcript_15216/m.49945 type:complete len:213 (-) Transcript_15216:816-1454(-)